MDISEYRQQVRPAKRKAKLSGHEQSILSLREEGYTLEQIAEFLALNGCEVSLQSIHKFLKKKALEGSARQPETKEKPASINETVKEPSLPSSPIPPGAPEKFDWNTAKNIDPQSLY